MSAAEAVVERRGLLSAGWAAMVEQCRAFEQAGMALHHQVTVTGAAYAPSVVVSAPAHEPVVETPDDTHAEWLRLNVAPE